jgi:DNA-binding transcriptional regulator GbsR (MarR family)
MNLMNGFTPLPNWFISSATNSNLTNREFKLYHTIGIEIFRFPESREIMNKEMSTRFLQSLTGINHSNVSRILKKFERRGLIRIIKSHVKGQGSFIYLIPPGAIETPDHVVKETPECKKSGVTITTNPINLSIKKDLQEEDLDSFFNSQEDQAIEENPMENSLNSSPDTKSSCISSEDSNLNNTAINSLSPRPGASATGKNEFTALGSVLPALISAPSSQQIPPAPIGAPVTAPPFAGLKPAIVEKGKTILQEKGFTAQQVQAITQRITDSIIKNKPIKPEGYFITAIKNEKIKTTVTSKNTSTCSTAPFSRQIPPGTGTGAPVKVQKNSFTETVNRWEEEKKKDISPEVVIKKLMALRPDDLYRVILHVDNSPAGKFISLPEIKASLYIAEFKKRFPEVVL